MSKYTFQGPSNVQIVEQGNGVQDNRTMAQIDDGLRQAFVSIRNDVERGEVPSSETTTKLEQLLGEVGQQLADSKKTTETIEMMVEELWLKHASAESRTALQKFVGSLPDRGAWELLKEAAKTLL